MGLDPVAARKVLAAVRLFNGAAALLVPGLMLRRLGAQADDRSGVYPLRLFGIRTVVIGTDLLLLRDGELRRATQTAVLIHACDTLSAATAGLRGDLPRRPAIAATLLSASNTGLAVLANRWPAA
jgi:hypothetical protein